MKKTIGVILVLPLLLWGGYRIVANIQFGRFCTGYLKRAADANTIKLATQEMEIAVRYLERNNLMEGYTSVVYRTPNEDVGFWYQNLKSALVELKGISAESSPLEKSNVLIKLRETLLDQDEKKTKVTVPPGISVFPHNTAVMAWAVLALVAVLVGVGFFIKGWEEDPWWY